MNKPHPPELKRYLDKKLQLKLSANRQVAGMLRGYDPFMNLVLDEAVEKIKDGVVNNIGIVVIRGESVLTIEALNQID